ncbi:hypothetical protein LMG29542_02343 [Paraburkholderia humisilvae]|uniref:Uncharacterized protein n=1 Tax=Paraburkholderia humisilvae TaxID=627669 RepID=A0A6J5DK01_9BURK|nr:hypothetical protein LMG29542_02343 [Paraburkholderia humisilvae]
MKAPAGSVHSDVAIRFGTVYSVESAGATTSSSYA